MVPLVKYPILVATAVPQLLTASTFAHIAQLEGTGVAQAQLGSPVQPLVATLAFRVQGEVCINVTSESSRLTAWNRDD